MLLVLKSGARARFFAAVALAKFYKKEKNMFKFRFLGNTRLPQRKNTAGMQAIRMPAPTEVLIPVEQHIGASATPIVKAGDEVKVGQLIAEAPSAFSSPIHSSVSGKVVKIDSILRSNGKTVQAIRIENDGLMTPYDGITPPEVTDLDSLVATVHSSGIIGLGGAGFPTAIKLEGAKKQKITTLILNGAECEPYITVDTRTMLDDADLISEGVELLLKHLPDLERVIIGIESNKPECIEKLNEIFADKAEVTVSALPARYPQGAEKVIIRNLTGITVPAGKLPADVGVMVLNVTTVANIARHLRTGMPLVEKRLTVDGSAVNSPKNLIVPIGSSIRDVLDFAGGLKEDAAKVILGGPMTGFAACSLDEPILKATGAVIAFTEKDSVHLKTTACIHCGRCVESCPHKLNPTAFTKALGISAEAERMQALSDLGITLCVECGCCSFVCPANRPLMENNRVAKNALRSYTAARKDLK